MPTVILAVDIGTSSLKAGLIDDRGRLIGFAHIHYAPNAPTDSWEANWWDQAFSQACRRLQVNDQADLAAVVVSGHGPSLVAMNENNEPIGQAVLWTNRQTNRLAGQPSVFLPKARYLLDRLEQAGLGHQLAWFATCSEYLAARLTNRPWAVIPHEGYLPHYWDSVQCQAYGIDQAYFPPFNYAGHWLGEVSRAAALRYGLPGGLAVFGGGLDFLMSIVGTDTTRPGLCSDRAGSSEGINVCASRPLKAAGLQTYPHALEGLWNVAGILDQSGLMFEWFRRLTGQTKRSYRTMIKDIEALPDQTDLPTFIPSLDQSADYRFDRGLFWGLKNSHGPAHISRAVVEHLGLAVFEAIKRFAAHGITIRELRASGGQAKNGPWCQMKADIVGLPIIVPAIIDAELTGAAAYGLLGLGLETSLADAAGRLVRFSGRYEPNWQRHKHFQRRQAQIDQINRQVQQLASAGLHNESPN